MNAATIFTLRHLPTLRGTACALIFILFSASGADAADCRDGRPTFSFGPVHSASNDVFKGSDRGTRVYGIVTSIIVTFEGTSRVFAGDSVIRCDDHLIRVRPPSQVTEYTFPRRATIRKVFGGESAVFAGLRMDPSLSSEVREQRALYLFTF